MQRDLNKYLKHRKEIYLKNQRENLTNADSARKFFAKVKTYNTVEKPKMFDVMDILLERTQKEVAGEVARFFNRISEEFEPLKPWEVPQTY